MINFDDIPLQITKEEILSKLSIEELWKYYIPEFKEIGKSFLSPLRQEKSPSCYIYIGSNNLLFKDFGDGSSYDIFGFIQAKYNCNFWESLNIISSDFSLRQIRVNKEVKNTILELGQIHRHDVYVKEKSNIIVTEQNWTLSDYNFWSQYKISFDLLEKYNIKSVKSVQLNKRNNRYIFNSSKKNIKFVYYFNNGLKIYSPYANKQEKWLCSGNNVEGFSQLPLAGDILILSKSLKDVICWYLVGFPAISLTSESERPSKELVNKLLKRFNKIIVCLDNDEQGVKSTILLNEIWDWDYIYINKPYKDLADGIKGVGLEKMKEEVKNKIDAIARR